MLIFYPTVPFYIGNSFMFTRKTIPPHFWQDGFISAISCNSTILHQNANKRNQKTENTQI